MRCEHTLFLFHHFGQVHGTSNWSTDPFFFSDKKKNFDDEVADDGDGAGLHTPPYVLCNVFQNY